MGRGPDCPHPQRFLFRLGLILRYSPHRVAAPTEHRPTLPNPVVTPSIARAIQSIAFKLLAIVWAFQLPLMVAIVWIAEGPPSTASDDSWWNAEVFGWWYRGMQWLALIWSLSRFAGIIFRKRKRRVMAEWRAAKIAQIESQLEEQRMSKFSFENLRNYDYPEFNVKELFLLHQRSEVVARCKVQVHRSHFAVILVIGGEYVRTTHCNTESEVWSLAAAWKAELLGQRWYPAHPTTSTVWRSGHGEWSLSVYGHSEYSGLVRRDGQPVLFDRHFALPTLALAQMEILRVLVEETGHLCSNRCTPWTFELRIHDSDMPS